MRRRRVARDDHLGHARQAIAQAAQRRLHFQDDARAARGDQRRVAQEMDRVAEPLLGVQQDRAAGDVFAAPLRPVEFPRIRQGFARAPAPLVFDPAAVQVAGAQPGHRAHRVGFGAAGIERDRAIERCQGFAVTALLLQRDAEVLVRVGQIGPQFQGATQRLLGFDCAIERQQRDPVIGVRRRELRIERQRLKL